MISSLKIGALVALLLFAMTPCPAEAQVRPELSIQPVVGIPQGGFADNVSRAGIGIDVMAGLRIQDTPALIGLDVAYMNYGIERRSEPFSRTIPDVTVDVRTTNDIILTHLLLRLQPEEGVLRPHVDGLFGFKYLFTSTRIEDRGSPTRDPVASSVNFDDFALSYGVGAGLDIRVFQYERENEARQAMRNIYLTMGARYLWGQEAEYLRRGSIERVDGDLRFDVRRSRTDLLNFSLGITLQF